MGSLILEILNDNLGAKLVNFSRVGIPDGFTKNYGSQNSLLDSMKITPTFLAEQMKLKLRDIDV